MPPSPETITLTKDGHTIAVSIDQAGRLIQGGYRPESTGDRRAREESELYGERTGGIGGTVKAGVTGALRGATFGGSDVLLRAISPSAAEHARELEGAHPIVSFGTQLAGGLIYGGSGAGEGLGAKIIQGAKEGAAFNAGNYVSDVALGNRDLSAEGAIAALGEGALWGGGTAGVLGAAGEGLTYARKMFPRATEADAALAESAAAQEMSRARDDGRALADAAKDRMRSIREVEHADPVRSAELHQVAADKASEVAAREPQAAVEQAVGAPIEAPSAEIPAPVAAHEPDDLMRQLAGTKSALEGGKTLKELSARGAPTEIEDAVNAHVAKSHPEMKGLVAAEDELRQSGDAMDAWLSKHAGGDVEKFQRKEAVGDWVQRTRPKAAQYYSSVPEGEGSLVVPRGRQFEFRGSELDQSIAELDTLSKFERGRTLAEKILNPREGEKPLKLRGEGYEAPIKGKSAAEAVEGKPGRPMTAQDVIDTSNAQLADRGQPPLDERIKAALRAKMNKRFVNEDVSEAIDAISRYERANADMADKLGPAAPPGAVDRAKAFRQAETAHAAKASEQLQRGIGDATQKAPGILSRVKDFAGKLGEATELLHMLGVHVPDPRAIPIIGPVLSLYLKAKIARRVLGKDGWLVGKTAEGVIAQKAAETQRKLYAAVDSMLGQGAKAANRAAEVAPAPAAVLAHTLFRAKDSPKIKPESDSMEELYQARAHELSTSQRPGAVYEAMADRIRASDPAIVDAMVAAKQRQLDFLFAKMPKPSGPAGLFDLEKAWTPDRYSLEQWSRYVEAAENPMAVLARATDKHLPTMEAVETLRTVYPNLYAAAQTRIVGELAKSPADVPYARRVQMSVIWNLPLDPSMAPGFGAFLQAGHPQPPLPPAPSPQPGNPTIRADVTVGKQTELRLDRKGA